MAGVVLVGVDLAATGDGAPVEWPFASLTVGVFATCSADGAGDPRMSHTRPMTTSMLSTTRPAMIANHILRVNLPIAPFYRVRAGAQPAIVPFRHHVTQARLSLAQRGNLAHYTHGSHGEVYGICGIDLATRRATWTNFAAFAFLIENDPGDQQSQQCTYDSTN